MKLTIERNKFDETRAEDHKERRSMKSLDSLFKFRIGQFVQPIGFQRSDEAYNRWEMRYRITSRMLNEHPGGIQVVYRVRGVSQSDCKMTHDLIEMGETELCAAEPFSEVKRGRKGVRRG